MSEDPNQPAPSGNAPATYTDDQVQAIVRKRLADERQKHGDISELRRKAEAYDAAQQAAQTDAERAAADIAKLQKENESLRLGQLRTDVAAKHGLTPTQAKRLVGATQEELDADAAELAKDLGIKPPGTGDQQPNGRPQPALNPVASTGATNTEQSAEEHPMNAWMRAKG